MGSNAAEQFFLDRAKRLPTNLLLACAATDNRNVHEELLKWLEHEDYYKTYVDGYADASKILGISDSYLLRAMALEIIKLRRDLDDINSDMLRASRRINACYEQHLRNMTF